MLSIYYQVTIILSGYTIAHDISGQFSDIDITEYSDEKIANNVSRRSVYTMKENKAHKLKETSNLDVSWQSLVNDITAEPIKHDMSGRRANKVIRSEPAQNTTKKVKEVTEKPISNYINKPIENHITETFIDTGVEANDKINKYHNISQSTSYITTTPNIDYKPYLDPPKNTLPPIQTQEKWNDSEWGGLGHTRKEVEMRRKETIRVYEEIINATTTCEEFLNNTVFDPEKVLNIDWHTIYNWNTQVEDPYNMRFTKPSDTMVKRFQTYLDAEINPKLNWSNAELFMETNLQFDALYIRTNVSGLYIVVPTAAFEYDGIKPIHFALKLVNDYLGIVNCLVKQCYALCDNEKRPKVEEVDKVAQSIGFFSVINSSYTRMPFDMKEYKEAEEMDSMEDSMNNFDAMNVEPLEMDIF